MVDGQYYLRAVGDRSECEVATSLPQPFGMTVEKDGFVCMYVCNVGTY